MVDYIQDWKDEAQKAFTEYKKRDCAHNIYTFVKYLVELGFLYAIVAQQVERSAVNRLVTGSSPVDGAYGPIAQPGRASGA